jgi:hypothetical protein
MPLVDDTYYATHSIYVNSKTDVGGGLLIDARNVTSEPEKRRNDVNAAWTLAADKV